MPPTGETARYPFGLLLLAFMGWSGPCKAQSPPLRMEPGLISVSAIHDTVQDKDYEQVTQVLAVDAAGTRLLHSWTIPDASAPDGVRQMTHEELSRAQDQRSARRMLLWYLKGDPETMPGTTSATPSEAVFDEIKTQGKADVVIGSLSESDGGLPGGLLAGRKYFRGSLRLLGHQQVRVLIDGIPTMLDTVHVGGQVAVGGDRANAEFLWLDRRDLRWALSQTFQKSTVRVVRIDRPHNNRLEQELASKSCRSEVPGVYFLTDSAQLLAPSRPAIEAIAATLKSQPSWTVTIEGHTDSIGSDAHNLALSKRRAESLKQELVEHYGVPAARLSTAGYGRTRPVDTNETLEGRAHNRRVELARRC